MTEVLMAAELLELVGPDPVPGHQTRWLSATDPTPRSADAVAIVSLLSRPIGQAELAGLPGLRIVANCAAGVNNIDLAAATRRGIIVTNTPEVLTDSTADLTWALILAATRRLKEGQRLIEEGRWGGWHPTLLLGVELRGRTLGIVGAGRIGQAVGRRAVGFGMQLLYNSPTDKPTFEQDLGARRADLPDLLRGSDIVTLHAPVTPVTVGLMNRDRLALMRRGAVLINTARGDLVDESALLDALDRGNPVAAGLDVYADEPRMDSRLVRHPRVITLPHIGSATVESRRAMATLAVGNVRAVLDGRPPLTPVTG